MMLLTDHTLYLVATLAAISALSPGPDVMYMATNALSGKLQKGLAAWAGISTGIICYAITAALGLSTLFEVVPALYITLKWLGVSYLAYIGYCCLKSALTSKKTEWLFNNSQDVPLSKIYIKGMFITLLNPKVMVFFTAFLPQFVDPNKGQVPTQLLALSFVSIVVGQSVYVLYTLLFVQIGRHVHNKTKFADIPSLARILNCLCGICFLSFAIMLAFWARSNG